jgi:hypothetical protein
MAQLFLSSIVRAMKTTIFTVLLCCTALFQTQAADEPLIPSALNSLLPKIHSGMNVFTTDHPITSKPSGGMQAATVVFALIAFLLFVAAGFAWRCGWVQEHLRRPVLQQPIRFENGFSLASPFSVRYEHYYWVEVVCPRTDSNRPRLNDVFSDLSMQLPIQFTITCDGVTVAEGDSPGE